MLRRTKRNKQSPLDYNLQCNMLLRWLLAMVATLHLNMANLGIDNKKSDVYSFGVLLLKLLTGQGHLIGMVLFLFFFFFLFFNQCLLIGFILQFKIRGKAIPGNGLFPNLMAIILWFS